MYGRQCREFIPRYWKRKCSTFITLGQLILPLSLPGAEASVKNIALLDLVPELKDLSSFYSYKGSLTTPPCYQSVNWIVLKEPIKLRSFVVRTFLCYFSAF